MNRPLPLRLSRTTNGKVRLTCFSPVALRRYDAEATFSFAALPWRSRRPPVRSGRYMIRSAAFTAPDERLVVQRVQVSLASDDLLTKPDGLLGLCLAEMPVGRTRKVVVPHATENGIQHDPLKAVIVAHRPVAVAGLRKCGHDRARQMKIVLDKRCRCRLWKIEIALRHLSNSALGTSRSALLGEMLMHG